MDTKWSSFQEGQIVKEVCKLIKAFISPLFHFYEIMYPKKIRLKINSSFYLDYNPNTLLCFCNLLHVRQLYLLVW